MSNPIVASGSGNQTINADLIEIVDASTNQAVTEMKVTAGRRLQLKVRARSPATKVTNDTIQWKVDSPHTAGRTFHGDGAVVHTTPRLNEEDQDLFFTGNSGKISVKVRAHTDVPRRDKDGFVDKRASEATVRFEVDAPKLSYLKATQVPLVLLEDGTLRGQAVLEGDFIPPSSNTRWYQRFWHVMDNRYLLDEKSIVLPGVRTNGDEAVTSPLGVNIDVIKLDQLPANGAEFIAITTRTFYFVVREGAEVIQTGTIPGQTIGLAVGKVICTWLAKFTRVNGLWALGTSVVVEGPEVAGVPSVECPR